MFISVINTSIAATWLILAVLLVRMVFRRTPRWTMCLLWGMAGLRLVLPFSLRSIFSLVPSAHTLPETIEYDAVPQIQSGVSVLNDSVNPILSEHFAATPQNSANPIQILLGVGGVIWSLGMLAMVLYLVVSSVVLRCRVHTATRLRDNIFCSEKVTSPFVMGIFRPRIYLPYALEGDVLESVVAHEQAHLRRGDHLAKPAAFLVLTLHWFNPLVWLGYILLCRDIELACDQRVIKDLAPEKRKAYSRALVCVGSGMHAAAACPLAFGEVGVGERVKQVLSYKKPALWVIIAAAAVCTLIALCFLTDPPHRPEDIFGRQLIEEKCIYHSPLLSSLSSPSRRYAVTADGRLVVIDAQETQNKGRLTEVSLTQGSFDNCFFEWPDVVAQEVWQDDITPAILRRENHRAWSVISGSERYTLLLQKDGSVYMASGVYLQSDPEAAEYTRVFLLMEDNNAPPDDLDVALNEAAISRNKGGYLSGEFQCAAHTVLETECKPLSDDTTRLTAYAIMLYEEYSMSDGVPVAVSGSNCPVAVTFDITSAGEYTLVEYWEPDDGTLYAPSLREKFPSGVSWDTQPGHESRRAECLRLACEHFGVSYSNVGGADASQVTTSTAVSESTSLDGALRSVVMKQYKDSLLKGDIACEAHTILDTRIEPGDGIDRLTVYAIVLYEEYSLHLGVPENVSAISTPAAVTFDVSPNGEYTLVEYYAPNPGEKTGEKLPLDLPWDSPAGSEERQAECLRQAWEHAGIINSTTDVPLPTTTAVHVLTDEKTYKYKTPYDIFGSCTLTVYGDGTAMLTFGYLSSYIAVGTCEQKGDILRIVTDEGFANTYVFRSSGEGYVFDAAASTQVPGFKPSESSEAQTSIPHGALFLPAE